MSKETCQKRFRLDKAISVIGNLTLALFSLFVALSEILSFIVSKSKPAKNQKTDVLILNIFGLTQVILVGNRKDGMTFPQLASVMTRQYKSDAPHLILQLE